MEPNRQLLDGHGRKVEYLRVSITDRCDLKCAYCMPTDGHTPVDRCDMLKLSQFLKIIEVFAEMGVRKVRVTGGEPLMRKGIFNFLQQVNEIPGIAQTALTTNGVKLAESAIRIKESGISIVNISLDSLKKDRFTAVTGRDRLSNVSSGIEAAINAGIDSVKVNMVVMRGVNDDEIKDFAKMTIDLPVQVRFIEFMPATKEIWQDDRFIPMDDVLNSVKKIGELLPTAKKTWGGPAQIYKLKDAIGEVGFISAVSNHFCGDCNRLRLTVSGQLMTCLFSKPSLDLRAMLENGAPKDKIKENILMAVAAKTGVREFKNNEADGRPPMVGIGG